jgi:post-segregation antitoxin (ccd killing protein)
MKQKTIKQEFRISVDQWSTLQVLSCYGVNISQFIRTAIAEKIKRDWKEIREKKVKTKIPF